jgi:hypothetical protein
MLAAFRERLQQSIARARARLIDPDALLQTLERLTADDVISGVRAASLRTSLPGQLDESRYILAHLGAHLGIAAVFAFDIVPLPLGTLCRVSWVAGNRLVERLRGDASHARVHSLAVFPFAAIPLLGCGAYLLPLRRQSAELAFLLANHAWLARTGRTYEQFVADTHPPIRLIARWLVPSPRGHEVASRPRLCRDHPRCARDRAQDPGLLPYRGRGYV